MDATNVTKLPGDKIACVISRVAINNVADNAQAATNCTPETLNERAVTVFISCCRFLSTARKNLSRSYVSPPKLRISRYPSIFSSHTCVKFVMASWIDKLK